MLQRLLKLKDLAIRQVFAHLIAKANGVGGSDKGYMI